MKHPHPIRTALALAFVAVLAPQAGWPFTLDETVTAQPDAPIDASEVPAPPRPKPIPLPDETRPRYPADMAAPAGDGYLPPTAVPVPSPYALPPQPIAPTGGGTPEYEFDLVVRYGDLEGGNATFAADHNALVTFVVDSDTLETLWVQDYNVGIAVQPGRPSILKFRAERPGRFAIWFGSARHEIAVLEVGPPAPGRTGPLPWSFE